MTQARFGHPITSDATPIRPGALRQTTQGRQFTLDPIEDRLWAYYDKVEGIGAYVSVLANAADLVTYFPAVKPDDPDAEPTRIAPEAVEDDDELVVNADVWQVWQEFGGEDWLSTWMSELVRHMSVPGQAWLVPAPSDDLDVLADEDQPLNETEWQVWSTKELRKALTLDPTAQIPEDDTRIWRIWMPHPQDHRKADSPVRRVKDKCELVVLLDRRRIGDSRTRLYAGVWALPARLSDEKTKSGKTWADLIEEELIAPIQDPQAASASVPTMLYLEPDEIDMLSKGVVSLATDDPERIDRMEENALRRIAIGIDAPQELILGMGDLNHWQAWLIEKSTYSQHLDPLLVRVLRSLGPWWRAQLKARGIDPTGQTLWRNPASAIAAPNRFADAQVIHERFALSDAALRREGDFSDEDAPDDEEIARRIAIAQAQTTRIEAVDVNEDEEPASPNPADEPDEEPEPEDPPIQAQNEDENGLPIGVPVTVLGLRLARVDETLLARVEREAAGQVNKLRRSIIDRIHTAARNAGIEVADRDTLPQQLGPARVAELVPGDLATPEDFDGEPFADTIATAQSDTADLVPGRNQDADADDRNLAVGLILAALTAGVVRSIFKPGSSRGETGIDGSEHVPFGQIRTALDQAGGGPAQLTSITEAAMLIGNGVRTVQDLAALGLATEAFEWVYGSIPRTPFPPHRDLDGQQFTRWDDPSLEQRSQTWVSGTHWFPGDHRGCRCTVQRVIVEAAA